jgi:predicted Holliday junction resolvase-like endonuclease
MNRFFTSFFITLLLLVQLAQNVYAEDNNLNDETDNTNLEEVVGTDSDEKEKNIRLEENVNEKNYDYNKYKIDFSKIKDRWIDLNNKLRDSI